jgi:UDPglucose 6-dehydrogenase
MYEAIAGAEALLVLTDWPEFAGPDFAAMRRLMGRPLILDGRNVVDAGAARGHGFEYCGVGDPSARQEPSASTRRRSSAAQ